MSRRRTAALALLGGPPAVPAAHARPRVLSRAVTGSAITLVRASRTNADLLCAHDGHGAVGEFERAFAEATGARFAVAVSSGTSALLGMLLAHDVHAGDEVLVNAYGWGSAAGAVRALGGTPVFVDIDDRLGMSAADAAKRITPRTRAILATHVHGALVDVMGLRALAADAHIPLLFDGAQALGAHWDGEKLGSMGAATAFSLGRRKLVYAGEGGVVVTQHRTVFERLVVATQHPLRARVEASTALLRQRIDEGSLSSRLHPVAAAIALAQIPSIEVRAERQRDAGRRILVGIAGCRSFVIPRRAEGDAVQTLVLRYVRPRGGPGRLAVVEALQAEGIPAVIGPVRVPLHRRRGFRHRPPHDSERQGAPSLPLVERFCREEEIMIEDEGCWMATSARRADALARGILKVDARLAHVRTWEVDHGHS